MYAIFKSGGKQYKVTEGDEITVEKLPAGVGELYTIEEVLAVSKEGNLSVGSPTLSGAKVTAKVLEHGKGDKIIVFKFKAKKNYRKKRGHRQPFTKLHIESISL